MARPPSRRSWPSHPPVLPVTACASGGGVELSTTKPTYSPGLRPGWWGRYRPPRPPVSPGLRLNVPTRLPSGSPGLHLPVWGVEKGGDDRRIRWLDDRMTGSVVSLPLRFSLSLRFASACLVFSLAVCVLVAMRVLSLRLLFPIWIPLMPCNAGYYAAVETCKSFFSPFPVPFFSRLFWSCFVSSFPVSLCFLLLSNRTRRKLQVAASMAWPWMSSVYVERQSDFIVRG